MSTSIDIGILELLSSKVCHDLISPIGAVNNGIEFLTEMGPDAGEEVTDLIAFSANQASAKLKAYRMAYGAGGADSSIKPEDVFKTIASIIDAEDKITQEWDPYGDLGYGDDRPDAYSKMLMCGFLLAFECMPKGGKIKVEAGDAGSTVIICEGDGAGPREKMNEALSLTFPRADLVPKFVHPYVTGLLAQEYGYTLTCEAPAEGVAHIIIKHPPA